MDTCAEAFSIAELDTAEALKRLAGFRPQQQQVALNRPHIDAGDFDRQPPAVTGFIREELVFVGGTNEHKATRELRSELPVFGDPVLMRTRHESLDGFQLFGVKAAQLANLSDQSPTHLAREVVVFLCERYLCEESRIGAERLHTRGLAAALPPDENRHHVGFDAGLQHPARQRCPHVHRHRAGVWRIGGTEVGMVEMFDARYAVPFQPVEPGSGRIEGLFIRGQQYHIADKFAPYCFKAAFFHCDTQARVIRIGERLPLAGARRREHDFIAELVETNIDINEVRAHNRFGRVADGGLDAPPFVTLERRQR